MGGGGGGGFVGGRGDGWRSSIPGGSLFSLPTFKRDM